MTKRRTAALLVAAASIALAGCGDSDNGVADLDADEIVESAIEAAKEADSVQVSGDLVAEGQEISLDIGFSADGTAGTMTVEGVEVELLSVDGDFYMKADADTWGVFVGNPTTGAMLADSYVLVPDSDPSFDFFADLADFDAFVDEMFSPEGSATKGEETEIGGQKVIGLVSDDDEGTLYVATTGEPLPIQLAAPEGDTGSLDFDWDGTVEVVAPDEDDVIDLTEFM